MTPTTTVSESHRIVRERQFSLDGGDDAILRALSQLRREHVTGVVMLHLACGGLCALFFQEEQKVDFNK